MPCGYAVYPVIYINEKEKDFMCSETFDLSRLPTGCRGTIVAINASGMEKNRFIDLGLAPSQSIKSLFKSPAKNPTAYEVMGAVFALRSEDAEKIIVCKESQS